MSEAIIDAADPRAEASDPVVILVNVRTGKIREIPCGPGDAGHFSGKRLVYWNEPQRRPEIPKKHAGEWRFYADYCADPAVAATAKLTVEQSRKYADAYLQFVRDRGVGAKATVINLDAATLAQLWHPSLVALREAHKQARGQRRVDTSRITKIIAELPRPAGEKP